jgi:hypothetical protein
MIEHLQFMARSLSTNVKDGVILVAWPAKRNCLERPIGPEAPRTSG